MAQKEGALPRDAPRKGCSSREAYGETRARPPSCRLAGVGPNAPAVSRARKHPRGSGIRPRTRITSALRSRRDANPSLTGSFVEGKAPRNNDNITASYSTTADASSPVKEGGYAIKATLSDPDNKLGNYEVTNNGGKLTITKAPLAVTADDKQKTYGDENPAFGVDYSGFLRARAGSGCPRRHARLRHRRHELQRGGLLRRDPEGSDLEQLRHRFCQRQAHHRPEEADG